VSEIHRALVAQAERIKELESRLNESVDYAAKLGHAERELAFWKQQAESAQSRLGECLEHVLRAYADRTGEGAVEDHLRDAIKVLRPDACFDRLTGVVAIPCGVVERQSPETCGKMSCMLPKGHDGMCKVWL
jgi:hypothetical protein